MMRLNHKNFPLVGQKFGKLTVIGRLPNKGKHSIWLCRCECGREKGVMGLHLRRGDTTSCGCSMVKCGNEHGSWVGIGEMSGYMWDRIRRNGDSTFSKVRKCRFGLEFTITKEYVWDLFLQQNCRCALTGLPLYFAKVGNRQTTASLDRIDNKKGYTPGNVQWVHKHINRMKNVYDQDYFINMCKLVYENSTI